MDESDDDMYHHFEALPPPPPVNVLGRKFMYPHAVDILITRKALSLSEGNFQVTDQKGNLMFKVTDKLFSFSDKHTLLDKFDKPLITFAKKRFSAHRKWFAYWGGSTEEKDMCFTLQKSSMIQLVATELDVFLSSNTEKKVPDFKVKGSFSAKHCTIFMGDGQTKIAQMYMQTTIGSLVIGKDTFGVVVYPNIDYAFIVALVIILDEIQDDRDTQAE